MSPVELVGVAVTTALGLLALAAVAGVLWARARSSSDETAVALWKEEAAAWKMKSERLEEQIADLARRVQHLEEENRVLRSLQDSRAEVASLRAAVNAGFAEIKTMLKEGS